MSSRHADRSTVADPSTAAAGHLRVGGDRCPGAVRLYASDDGALARVRIPGGLLDARQADAIAAACLELGDGAIHLTSRGNVQLRGLPGDAGPDLADRLYAVGLLPSVAHERARNVVASPLTGLDGAGLDGAGLDGAGLDGAGLDRAGLMPGEGGVHQWVRELDGLLCGDPRLTELSGRFLFGFDDGRGDILTLSPDVALVAVSPLHADVVVNGTPIGVRVPVAHAAPAAVIAAHAFLDQPAVDAGGAWRISDLAGDARETLVTVVRDRLLSDGEGVAIGSNPANEPGSHHSRSDSSASPRLGCVIGSDGSAALSAGVPLGKMPVAAWNALVHQAIRGDGTLRLTPWRGVVLPGFAAADAAQALADLAVHGLLTESDSSWFGATACAGRPGCSKSLADVHADAARTLGTRAMVTGAKLTGATNLSSGIPLLPVHWSGCDRRCGHPIAAHIDVVATGAGYLVGRSGGQSREVTNHEMAQAVSAARRAL